METVQEIHTRMLANTSEEQDRSNGSFVFDVERAAAVEFEGQQEKIQIVQSKIDILNLSGDELTRVVYQRTGINRRLATKSTLWVVVSGSEGALINIGDYVATDTVEFLVTEEKTVDSSGSTIVQIECALFGKIGNVPANSINRFPSTIPGIVNVYNPNEATNGYEAETDEELLERYFDRLQRPGKSGNKFHYEEWAKEVAGVGDAKVFERFNGPLTMRVVVINQDKLPAPVSLVNEVREHIVEEMPFGVEELLVESALPLILNISVDLTLIEGFMMEVAVANIKETIATDYLKKIALKSSFVSYAKMGALIIESDGVLDYQNLLINGTTANIAIPDDSVAIMGGINE